MTRVGRTRVAAPPCREGGTTPGIARSVPEETRGPLRRQAPSALPRDRLRPEHPEVEAGIGRGARAVVRGDEDTLGVAGPADDRDLTRSSCPDSPGETDGGDVGGSAHVAVEHDLVVPGGESLSRGGFQAAGECAVRVYH